MIKLKKNKNTKHLCPVRLYTDCPLRDQNTISFTYMLYMLHFILVPMSQIRSESINRFKVLPMSQDKLLQQLPGDSHRHHKNVNSINNIFLITINLVLFCCRSLVRLQSSAITMSMLPSIFVLAPVYSLM